ncbi:NADH-quinone oxidoreductase subunit NuoB [Acidithiobacillus concretivorus]|uniref:NADH-quinone oxidoreductase subunit NuoB n=1 Tax=Acidithiobacillus concretivorus TaxID=3063952 RepID=A0ABS5ZS81_9PROT|nr:NADH-quinone oxidoreductase subunit NuoB [Acidithiobacillus concretivorus]MBU2739023.1 NADH-quinone oxidoreductase subunit NuoB [Acidithiobacillus concretivorus]
MSFWPYYGLQRGITTTSWPDGAEDSPGITPGRPRAGATERAEEIAALCPTQALKVVSQDETDGVAVDFSHCIHCQRCRQGENALPWTTDFSWGAPSTSAQPSLGSRFTRSLQVLYVDAGACGACVNEVRLIDAPPYNLHRLGIFVTATPRDADVLLVAGPITDAMRTAISKAYAAMPEPKRVMGMGTCAINGGVFGESFACAGGLEKIVPVDLWLPGCPPPPLAIIHGLLSLVGRVAPAALEEQP